MSIKRVVGTAFWDDEKVVNDFTPEDKYFFLYLLTNPRSSMLGVYKLVPKLAAFEMGYSVDAVNTLIERFETKHQVIRYNRETCEVAIKNYLKHSIVKGGKPIYDRLVADLKQVTDKSLFQYIRDNLTGLEGLNQTVLQFLANTSDGSAVGQYKNADPQQPPTPEPPLPDDNTNVPNGYEERRGRGNGDGNGNGNGVTPPLRGRNGDVTSDDDDGLPFGLTAEEVENRMKELSEVEKSALSIGLPFASGDAEQAERLLGDYGFEWVIKAIERTRLRERRAWGTVLGILRSWKKKGGIDAEAREDDRVEDDGGVDLREWFRDGKKGGK